MARFGKLPVTIPSSVTLTLAEHEVLVKGPKGELKRTIPEGVLVEVADGKCVVSVKNESKKNLSLQGTIRSHILNMVEGVTNEFKKELEIVGAGYRGEVQGNKLVMQIGYSHPVTIEAPHGISFKIEKNIVTVSGADKEMVGHIASLVRGAREPEPYKGTGIKYTTEVIRRKAGKQAAK